MGKKKYSVTKFLESQEKLIEKDKLTTILYQMLTQRRESSILHTREQVRMASALAELHDNVQDGRARTSPPSSAGSLALKNVNISHENILIELLLTLAHPGEEDSLVLRWQALFHVDLESSEHEWSQNLMQLRYELILLVGVIDIQIEPIIELLSAGEDVWNEEVEESP